HNSNDTEKTLASLRDETHLIVRIRPDPSGGGGAGGIDRSRNGTGNGAGDNGGDSEEDDTDDNMIDASGSVGSRGRRDAGGSGYPRQFSRDCNSDDNEKSAGSGSDEDDSLLVAYDSNSVASV
ncbi:ATP-dependent RNA helicase laf-1-like, partial [Topomyia yanbarensis]|uniref:ATP-dependent RNA helicase laf-1-like n=1 Tax=Topomyia yanbarensis TaxID=2498891 RepID=UPI00273A836B